MLLDIYGPDWCESRFICCPTIQQSKLFGLVDLSYLRRRRLSALDAIWQ